MFRVLLIAMSFVACVPGTSCGGRPNQMKAPLRAEVASVWFETPEENRLMRLSDFELTDAGAVLTSNSNNGAAVFLDGTTEVRRITTSLKPRAVRRLSPSRFMVATDDGVTLFDGELELELNPFFSSTNPTSRGLGGLVGVVTSGSGVSELRVVRPSPDQRTLETEVLATLPGVVSSLSCTEDHCLATVRDCTSRIQANGSVSGERCLEPNPNSSLGTMLIPSPHADLLIDSSNGHVVSLDAEVDVELAGEVMAAGLGPQNELLVVGDFRGAMPAPRSTSFQVARVTTQGGVQPYEVGGGLEPACFCSLSAAQLIGNRLSFAIEVSPDHALGGRTVPAPTAAMVTLLLLQ